MTTTLCRTGRLALATAMTRLPNRVSVVVSVTVPVHVPFPVQPRTTSTPVVVAFSLRTTVFGAAGGGIGQTAVREPNSAAPISTTAVHVRLAKIRVAPYASDVTPAGTSAFEPASIVGLAAVSWTSPLAAPASFGSAHTLCDPGNGVLVPGLHTSLYETAADPPPPPIPKPPMFVSLRRCCQR